MYPPDKPSSRESQDNQAGQGFTEYAIILMLVGISVVLIITVMGPTLEGVFSRIARQDRMAPPNLANYTPPPTSTEDPSGGTPTSTPTQVPAGSTETPTPSITPTPTETPTTTPTVEASPTATLPPLSNLCLNPGVTTSQSSTASSYDAARACNGNTNGVLANGSVSRTNSEPNAYWEVSLGKAYVLQQLKIFNRTDADVNDLSNFYVFVTNSSTGFSSTDLTETRNDRSVTEYFFTGGVDSIAKAMNNIPATHIRIQLGGTGNLNLAEVEIIGASYIANQCDTLADMFYIFDTSGSMSWDFPGEFPSKIAAAKDAVITVNNAIAAAGGDSRVGFVTFTTNGTYTDYRERLNIDLDTIALTENIAGVNAIVENWQAVGGTPTGAAINEARRTMVNTWDPLRTPVVVLVSDGVPTVDQDGLYYADSHVQNVVIYGAPHTADYVENTGNWQSGWRYYSSNRAGYVVADTMREIQELKSSLPDVTVHSIAIGGNTNGGFNTEVLQYVADIGGGDYVPADNPTQLTDQLMAIFNSISCNPDS